MRQATLGPLQQAARAADTELTGFPRKSPHVLPPLRGVDGLRPRLKPLQAVSQSPQSPKSPLVEQGTRRKHVEAIDGGPVMFDCTHFNNMSVPDIFDEASIIPGCQIDSQNLVAGIPGYFCYCTSFSLFIYTVSGSTDGSLPVFQPLRVINFQQSHILSLTVDKQTMQAAVSSMDNRIHMHSLLTGEPTQDIILELKLPPICIKFHPVIQHSLFLLHYSTMATGELRLIHSLTGRSTIVKSGLEKALALVCSPYNKELAISFESGEVMIIGLSPDGSEAVYTRSLLSGSFTSKFPDLISWNTKHNKQKDKAVTVKNNLKYLRNLIDYVSNVLIRPVEPVSMTYDPTNHETLLIVFAFGLHCLFNTATGDCLILYFAQGSKHLDIASSNFFLNANLPDQMVTTVDARNLFAPNGTLPSGVSSCAFLPGEAGGFLTTDCNAGIVRFWTVSNKNDQSSQRISSLLISQVYILELDPDIQPPILSAEELPPCSDEVDKLARKALHFIILFVDSQGGITVYTPDLQTIVFRIPSAHCDKILSLKFDPFNPSVFCTAGVDGLVKQWSTDFVAMQQQDIDSVTFLAGGKQYQRTLLVYNSGGRLKTWRNNKYGKTSVANAPPSLAVLYAPLPDVPYILCSYVNGDIRFFQKHSGRHTCDLITASSFYNIDMLIPRKHHFFSDYDKDFFSNVFTSTFQVHYALALAWSDVNPGLIATGWTDGCVRFFLSTYNLNSPSFNPDDLVMSFRLLAVFSVPQIMSAPDYKQFRIRALTFIPHSLILIAVLEVGYVLFINTQPLLSKTIHSLFNMCYDFHRGENPSATGYSAINNDLMVQDIDKADVQNDDEKLYRQFRPLFTETAAVCADPSTFFIFNLTISYDAYLNHRNVMFQHSSYTSMPLKHYTGTPRRISCFDLHPRVRLDPSTDAYNIFAVGDYTGVVSFVHFNHNMCTENLMEGRMMIIGTYTCMGTIGNYATNIQRRHFIHTIRFIREYPTCLMLSTSSGDLQLIDYTQSKCLAQAKSIKTTKALIYAMDIHPSRPYTCIVAGHDNSIRQFNVLFCGLGMSFLGFLVIKYLWAVYDNRSPYEFASAVMSVHPFKSILFDTEGFRAVSSVLEEAEPTVQAQHPYQHLTKLTSNFSSILSFFQSNQASFQAIISILLNRTSPYSFSHAYGYWCLARRVEAVIVVLLYDIMHICQVPVFPSFQQEVLTAYETYTHFYPNNTTFSMQTDPGIDGMVSALKKSLDYNSSIYTLGSDLLSNTTTVFVSGYILATFRYILQLVLLANKRVFLAEILSSFGFYNQAIQVSVSFKEKKYLMSHIFRQLEDVAKRGAFTIHPSILDRGQVLARSSHDTQNQEVIFQNVKRLGLKDAIPSDFNVILMKTSPESLATYLLSKGRHVDAKIALSFALCDAVTGLDAQRSKNFSACYGGSANCASAESSGDTTPEALASINKLYAIASLNVANIYCDSRQSLAAVCELLVTRDYDQAIRLLILSKNVFILIMLLIVLIKDATTNPKFLIPQRLYRFQDNEASWDLPGAVQWYKSLLVILVIELYYTHVHRSVFYDELSEVESHTLEPMLMEAIGPLYNEVRGLPFDKTGILSPSCLSVGDIAARYSGQFDADCAAQIDEQELLKYISNIQGRIEIIEESATLSAPNPLTYRVSFRSLIHLLLKKINDERHKLSGTEEIRPNNSDVSAGAQPVPIRSTATESAAKPIILPRRPLIDQEEQEEQLGPNPQSNTAVVDDDTIDGEVFRLDIDLGHGIHDNDDATFQDISDLYRYSFVPIQCHNRAGDAGIRSTNTKPFVAMAAYELISALILKLTVTKDNWLQLSPYISCLSKYIPCTNIQRTFLPTETNCIAMSFLGGAGCSYLYGQCKTARTIALSLNRIVAKYPYTEVLSIKEIITSIIEKKVDTPVPTISDGPPLHYKGETYFNNADGSCFSLFLPCDKYMRWNTATFV